MAIGRGSGSFSDARAHSNVFELEPEEIESDDFTIQEEMEELNTSRDIEEESPSKRPKRKQTKRRAKVWDHYTLYIDKNGKTRAQYGEIPSRKFGFSSAVASRNTGSNLKHVAVQVKHIKIRMSCRQKNIGFAEGKGTSRTDWDFKEKYFPSGSSWKTFNITRAIGEEKNGLQSALEKELDRKSVDWSMKLEKYQAEDNYTQLIQNL